MSTLPPAYSRQASFTNFHTEPAPTVGQDIEAELNAVKTSLDATQSRLREIQRDDGQLANLSVHPDALSSAVRALLSIDGEIRGQWATGLVYGIGDVIEGPDGITYISTVQHVGNASFAVDVSAGRWISIDSGLTLDTALRAEIIAGTIEGPLRGDLASALAAKGTSLSTHLPLGTTTLAVALRNWLGNAQGVPVTNYANDAALAVDATAAVVAAIADARALGKNAVYFPSGRTYRFAAASAAIDPGTTDIEFYGDGWASKLIFEEGTSVASIHDRKNLFKNVAAVAKGRVMFRDLHLQGTWEESGWTTGQGGSPIVLDHYDEIVLDRVLLTNFKSYVTVCEFNKNVRVIGCTFDTNARDNVRFRSSFNVQVIGNRFAHCDDDAVALHCNTNVTGGDIREGIIVANNVFEDTHAVQILGGRMVSVHHNILRRCKQNGILVYTSAGTASEGDSSVFGVDVSNNQIYDMMNDYPFTTGVSQAIAVYQRPAEAISGSVIPGTNITASGTFPLPWDHRNGQHDSATDGIPPPFFIRIQNNIIARTLPAVATYSTWGYGSTYAGDGPHDPAVTNTSLRPSIGIILGGQARKAIVSGNIISHVGSAVSFDADPLSNYVGDGVVIRDNILSDYSASAVTMPAPAAARATNLLVADNDIDGDPYHVSSNRGAAGTWLADTVPNALSCLSYQGIRFARNKIRNVARVLDNGGSVTTVSIDKNILRCDPTATGFSASNKGIGNCPAAGPGYDYEIFDSDPTSATYGAILVSTARDMAAMPASGKYVFGTFIFANSGTTIYGWKRLTTGSAHVAGTDWKTVALA